MSNTKIVNREACTDTRREMSRHSIDCGEVQITSTHGVIRLYGKVRPMRGREATFEEDVTVMLKSLRQQRGVRDVITEWTCRF